MSIEPGFGASAGEAVSSAVAAGLGEALATEAVGCAAAVPLLESLLHAASVRTASTAVRVQPIRRV